MNIYRNKKETTRVIHTILYFSRVFYLEEIRIIYF